jgi:hypothetical protein
VVLEVDDSVAECALMGTRGEDRDQRLELGADRRGLAPLPYGRTMAQLSNDDIEAVQRAMDEDAARALGRVRRKDGAQRNEELRVWLRAGSTLAEKAIAALDLGDDERAVQLARRIVALPVVDEETRSGLMAVNLLLYNEVVDPSFSAADDARGLLDLPLRLLPTLDPWAADALRHVLASFTDYDLPAAIVRRISAVVPLERKLEPPFLGVPEEALPDAVLSVLRLALRLRSED